MGIGYKPKFETIEFESLSGLVDAPDGFYLKTGREELRSDDFVNERDMSSFFEEHVSDFCRDVLGDKMVSFEFEYPIDKQWVFSQRGRRADLVIHGENKTFIVEFKRPKTKSGNREAIGQLLDYGREFLDSKKELVLITSHFDVDTAKTIEHYNLPIRYIFVDKTRSLDFFGFKEYGRR